jgi:hypothetical protein
VPRLIAALGTQRDRYQSASELQSYSGIAPVLASSGKQCWVHWRWACPKFLRQTFHEWATHTIGSSAWAKSYYEQQRAKGKSRNTVVRAPAFKWIRILFRCWKDRKPYSEEVYRQAGLSSPTRRQESHLCNCSGKLAPALAKSLRLPLDTTAQMSVNKARQAASMHGYGSSASFVVWSPVLVQRKI